MCQITYFVASIREAISSLQTKHHLLISQTNTKHKQFTMRLPLNFIVTAVCTEITFRMSLPGPALHCRHDIWNYLIPVQI